MWRFRSRKFWLTLIGTVGPPVIQLVTDGLGWDRVVVISGLMIAVYVAAEGYVDGQERRHGSPRPGR